MKRTTGMHVLAASVVIVVAGIIAGQKPMVMTSSQSTGVMSATQQKRNRQGKKITGGIESQGFSPDKWESLG